MRTVIHTILLVTVAANAGPIAPPAGPVSSTYKTLDEVEPRTPIDTLGTTITMPGSYYLTDSLEAAFCGAAGITINADNVTIDLNGNTIYHNFACALAGIQIIGGAHSNITIKNGAIRGFDLGIDAAVTTDCTFENLLIEGSVQAGLAASSRCHVKS